MALPAIWSVRPLTPLDAHAAPWMRSSSLFITSCSDCCLPDVTSTQHPGKRHAWIEQRAHAVHERLGRPLADPCLRCLPPVDDRIVFACRQRGCEDLVRRLPYSYQLGRSSSHAGQTDSSDPQARHVASVSDFREVPRHVGAADRLNHLIDVGRVYEGFDPPRPRTAIQMSADTSERAHRNTEKRRQALMRRAQLVRPQHEPPIRGNRLDARVDVPVPRMQVRRHRKQSKIREGAIVRTVRVPLRPEPPSEELVKVAGYAAAGDMTGDRLQPRVAQATS